MNAKGQSSTRKLCCVQCPAQPGAVHVQLKYCSLNGSCKAHKNHVLWWPLDQWWGWIGRFHWAACLYIIMTWGVDCGWGILSIISLVLSAQCEHRDFSEGKMIPRGQVRNTRGLLTLSRVPYISSRPRDVDDGTLLKKGLRLKKVGEYSVGSWISLVCSL